jgi:sporulation protein YlmC with PRC-barrel domain
MPAFPPAQSSQPGGQSQVLLDASAVIGSTVRNSEGKDIGKVSRLMIDPRDGRVSTVVVGMGGMLGMGEKLVSMPWNSVKIGQDGGQIVVVTDQRLLDQAPSAERDRKTEPAASPATGSQDSKNKDGQKK